MHFLSRTCWIKYLVFLSQSWACGKNGSTRYMYQVECSKTFNNYTIVFFWTETYVLFTLRIPNSTPSKKELLDFSHVLGSFFSAHNLSIVCNMYHLRQQRKLSNLVKFTSSISFMYNFVSCLLFSSFLDQVHMHFQKTFTLKNCYFQNRKNGLTNLNCDQCLKCQMID